MGQEYKYTRGRKVVYSAMFPRVFLFLAEGMHYLSLTHRNFAVVIKVRRGRESYLKPQLYSGALRMTYCV